MFLADEQFVRCRILWHGALLESIQTERISLLRQISLIESVRFCRIVEE